jgi:hypothetical protein
MRQFGFNRAHHFICPGLASYERNSRHLRRNPVLRPALTMASVDSRKYSESINWNWERNFASAASESPKVRSESGGPVCQRQSRFNPGRGFILRHGFNPAHGFQQ